MRTLEILVADDEPELAKMLARLLSRHGHSPTVVHDGEEAWGLRTTRRFDLLISDVRMPGLGGLDLLRRLRSDGDRTPMLLMAGNTSDAPVSMLSAMAPVEVIAKPFRIGTVLGHIEQLCTPTPVE